LCVWWLAHQSHRQDCASAPSGVRCGACRSLPQWFAGMGRSPRCSGVAPTSTSMRHRRDPRERPGTQEGPLAERGNAGVYSGERSALPVAAGRVPRTTAAGHPAEALDLARSMVRGGAWISAGLRLVPLRTERRLERHRDRFTAYRDVEVAKPGRSVIHQKPQASSKPSGKPPSSPCCRFQREAAASPSTDKTVRVAALGHKQPPRRSPDTPREAKASLDPRVGAHLLFAKRAHLHGVDREAPRRVTSTALLFRQRRISCLLDCG
jgi:hypothetical protein